MEDFIHHFLNRDTAGVTEIKHQAPGTKFQRIIKHRASKLQGNSNHQSAESPACNGRDYWSLRFGASLVLGTWCLELISASLEPGTWSLVLCLAPPKTLR
jgi:hypothetical protein